MLEFKGFGQSITFFTIGDIQKRLFYGKLRVPFDKSKTKRTSVVLNGVEKEISLSYDVIHKYFEYLVLLGFVSVSGYTLISRRPISLEAPKRGNGKALEYILSEIDPCVPYVDGVIENRINEIKERLSSKQVIEEGDNSARN